MNNNNNNNNSPFSSTEPNPIEQRNTGRLACLVIIVVLVFLIIFTCI
jgi:hypothetical protein